MNKTPKIIFRTVARNAETTIARTIESVSGQTYKNWELHLVNNGSTDKTGAVTEDYARKDTRIKVFTNEGNYIWKDGNRFFDYYKEYDPENTYLCYIDGDDEYKPDFLEKMLDFAEQNALDIAACGYDLVDTISGCVIDTLAEDEAMIITGKEFGELFPEYYMYMRTRWGKLFKLTLIDKINISGDFDMLYGGDTVETLEYYRCAARAGIYPGAFYVYYSDPNTVSYRWVEGRTGSDRLIYDLAEKFLIEKAGNISARNRTYLNVVYMSAISRSVDVLLKTDVDMKEKFEVLADIFLSEHTRKTAQAPIPQTDTEQRLEFFQTIVDWLTAQEEYRDSAYYDRLTDIFAVTQMLPQDFPGWTEPQMIKLLEHFANKYRHIC